MNLLLTLPYCTKDAGQLEKNLEWMATLQRSYRPHSCLLVANSDTSQEQRQALAALAKPLFEHVTTIQVNVPADRQSWPQAPNMLFAAAARQIAECFRLPWLWLEPDAIPLVPGWLGTIATAYANSPKRLMGSLITSDNQADMPPVHLAGCAVYDAQAYHGLAPFLTGKLAWDIASASWAVPRAANFPRMQHFWGKHDLPPTFSHTKTVTDPENVLPLSFIRSESVTFHRNKDGTLIDLLRQKANSRPVKATPKHRPTRSSVPARTVSEVVPP